MKGPNKLPDIPENYKDFVVQDITIKPHNTRYRLKIYETPEGGYVAGQLPAYLNGKHFGSMPKLDDYTCLHGKHVSIMM